MPINARDTPSCTRTLGIVKAFGVPHGSRAGRDCDRRRSKRAELESEALHGAEPVRSPRKALPVHGLCSPFRLSVELEGRCSCCGHHLQYRSRVPLARGGSQIAAVYGITVSIPRCGLGPDGVLVEWSFDGFPGWTLAREPGQPVLVDGRPGKESFVPTSRYCASGTEEGVILVVARTFPDNYYEMDACLRGPELGREASEIQAMIASTKVLQP